MGDTVINACTVVTAVHRGGEGAERGLVTDEVRVGLGAGATAGDG